MSIFSTILEKLGLKKEVAKPTATKVYSTVTGKGMGMGIPSTKAAMPTVDVMAKLSAMAAKNKEKLDWKVSIVDLLKLLGIDSSFANRKSLATELGCPENLMKDSAAMNTWLHKTVMQKLAANGGNIPRELL